LTVQARFGSSSWSSGTPAGHQPALTARPWSVVRSSPGRLRSTAWG
jgi:hypothetical protein